MGSYTIYSRKRNDDLHVQLTGNFNECSAYALKCICNAQYSEGGRLFIDLRNLISLEPRQNLQFKQLLGEISIPAQCMFLKGEQALNIGYDGTRILIVKSKKCACISPCITCSCKKRMQHKLSQSVQ